MRDDPAGARAYLTLGEVPMFGAKIREGIIDVEGARYPRGPGACDPASPAVVLPYAASLSTARRTLVAVH